MNNFADATFKPFELIKNGTSHRKIAKICKVDRNTLARFIKLKGLAEN